MKNTALPMQIRVTIAQGALAFREEGHSVSFFLSGEKCTVSGRLNVRPDWIGKGGRPGVMPIVTRIELDSGTRLSWKFLQDNPELVEDAYPILQQRLSPERIFEHDEELGWQITSFKSKPLDEEEIYEAT